MGDCQNYGPFLGPYYNTGPNLGDPKRDHNFDNHPYCGPHEAVRASGGVQQRCIVHREKHEPGAQLLGQGLGVIKISL